jgi:hypothetical protein
MTSSTSILPEDKSTATIALANGSKIIINKKPSIEWLFAFSSKSLLRKKVAEEVKANPAELKELRAAIDHNNFDAPIFSHEKCEIYALALMQIDEVTLAPSEREQSFWRWNTLLLDLIALRQFTDKQHFKKPEDVTRKLSGGAPLEKFSLLHNPSLLATYVLMVKEKCREMGHRGDHLTPEAVKVFLQTCLPREQMVLRIPFDAVSSSDTSDTPEMTHFRCFYDTVSPYQLIKKILLDNVPWLCFDDSKKNLFIPSFSLLQYILQPLSDFKLNLFPMYGRISSQTLNEMHQNGFRVISLFSNDVDKNLINAHLVNQPMWILLHDITHDAYIRLFSHAEIDTIFNVFIPVIRDWNKLPNITSSLKQFFNEIIENAGDFDLTHVAGRGPKATLLARYLAKALYPYLWGDYRGVNPLKQLLQTQPFGNTLDNMYALIFLTIDLAKKTGDEKLHALFSAIQVEFHPVYVACRPASILSSLNQSVARATNSNIKVTDEPIHQLQSGKKSEETDAKLEKLATSDEKAISELRTSDSSSHFINKILKSLIATAMDKIAEPTYAEVKDTAKLAKTAKSTVKRNIGKDFSSPIPFFGDICMTQRVVSKDNACHAGPSVNIKS